MPASDPWLSRQNEALKVRRRAVSLELAGSRVRLQASMPPKPADRPGSPWRQQRISTGLEYPARASEAVELAETLGRSLERSRLGLLLMQSPGQIHCRRRVRTGHLPAVEGQNTRTD